MTRSYWNPTKRILADGAFENLPEIIRTTGAKNVLLVLGSKSFRSSAHCLNLKKALSGIQIIESIPVGENPKISFVEDFVQLYKPKNCDLVLGVGGGSVLDVAKMTALLLGQPDNALQAYLTTKERFSNNRPYLIAVPTTSGTGSEVTPYASLETEARAKITITHDRMYPDLALLDPLLTHSMPASVTASTGIDALSQSIEAFWSVHQTPFSDVHALRSVSLVIENLKNAVLKPHDAHARYGMSLASCESGLAIAQTATTAVHSVSYPITTHFGVPHGHACGLTLAQFLRFNETHMKAKRYELLWEAMNVKNAHDAATAIEKLMDDISLERKLSKLKIDKEGVELIIKNGFRPDRVKNNPRALTPEELRVMLQNIY